MQPVDALIAEAERDGATSFEFVLVGYYINNVLVVNTARRCICDACNEIFHEVLRTKLTEVISGPVMN